MNDRSAPGTAILTNEDERQLDTTPLGVSDAFLVYAAPRRLFSRVEDTGAYGRALAVLLALFTLIGYAEVKTGLIDRVVAKETEAQKAELEEARLDLVDLVELREQLEGIEKGGEFKKLITRWGAIAAPPTMLLTASLLISSFLYAVVALTGRKPEFHTLMAVCVYAAYIELVAHVLRLAMMLYYRSIYVDTSLGALATTKGLLWLGGIDPFRIWFWVLVGIGLAVTQQLSRRMAIISCVGLGLVTTAARAVWEYVTL